MKRHHKTHGGGRPFPCNGGCGKSFSRKDALKRHQVRRKNWVICNVEINWVIVGFEELWRFSCWRVEAVTTRS